MNEFKLNTSFVRAVRLDWQAIEHDDGYPFSLAAVQQLQTVDFHKSVTFFVGENGSGKSTLLEALAVNLGFNAEGGTQNFNFSTEATHSQLHTHLRVTKGVYKPLTGFFLRAESFYNVATAIDELDRTSSMGNPIINSYGGVSLHQQSHGESFLSLMIHRFGPKGLYILDEPEAALSPMRLMTMLARLHELVQQGSQFIIATHSPILMAYPDSVILDVEQGYKPIAYRDTAHYQTTRRFLEQPEKMMGYLLDESE